MMEGRTTPHLLLKSSDVGAQQKSWNCTENRGTSTVLPFEVRCRSNCVRLYVIANSVCNLFFQN
jgi:hypothetical protein